MEEVEIPALTAEDAGPNVYRIALSMSGAISAGAYTAGVLDFLLQALAELYYYRNNDLAAPEDLPPHDVRIVAITGASAGGIASALGAIALSYGMAFNQSPDGKHRTPSAAPTCGPDPIRCVLPSLYEAWVLGPRMMDEGKPCLLSTEDLVASKSVKSLLNSTVLEGIRDRALRRPDALEAATAPQAPPYDFVAEPMHAYLTISNLPGIPYAVRGAKDRDDYRMVSHGDRLHFCVSQIGKDPTASSRWAREDAARALSVQNLAGSQSPPEEWKLFGDGALATAAFPGGLSARVLQAVLADYGGVPERPERLFPAPRFPGAPIRPDWPSWMRVEPEPFGYVNVDGGMINNDPFDFARYCLLDHWEDAGASNPRQPGNADQAVIMISPFPEGAVLTKGIDLDTGLMRIAKSLLPTLLQQARLKIDELAAAADPTYASRWLIAPRRTANLEETPSSANIACGLLGGFGGFLDQRFREHDFVLGQRNCQQFLKYWTDSRFTREPGQTVIPLIGSALREVKAPAWPRMSQSDFKALRGFISKRADAMIPLLKRDYVGSSVLRCGIGIAWSVYLKGKLLDTAEGLVLADLIRRDQIEDGLPSGDQRSLRLFSEEACEILATLADPGFDLRTVQGISKATAIAEDMVTATLERATRLPPRALHCVVSSSVSGPNGAKTYTLACRRLSWRQTLCGRTPGIRKLWGPSIG